MPTHRDIFRPYCRIPVNALIYQGEAVGTIVDNDARKIAFTSNRDGNREIYVMNDDGSGQANLTNNPADDSQPAWSSTRNIGSPGPDGIPARFRDGCRWRQPDEMHAG